MYFDCVTVRSDTLLLLFLLCIWARLLHSMASGIQIAIKGLSVSSWCSIDLQQESNPDYEVQ